MALTAVLVVAFCLGLLRANSTVFWNDDYQISILPVFADIARSWREGQWPLLSPYSWACGNLAGEYQYGTFSLFVNAVVIAVWQWPLSFAAQAAAMSIVHLAVLGAGGCLLARQRRLSAPLAVMVGLVAALNGWEIGWGATDWFGALAAHAWLPWAWWAFEMALEPAPVPQRARQLLRWLLPAPFVYLVLTGGFPYTVVMLLLVTAWLAARMLVERRFKAVWPLTTGWIFGLGLSAPAWLSLLQAMKGSGRSEGVGPGNHAWTLPLSSLPGAVLPNWSTNWHNFSDVPSLHAALELTGAFVPLVGLVVALLCFGRRFALARRWDLALLGLVLLLCLLPSPGVFRWSFRWLPLLHIVLALVGAHAWAWLAEERTALNHERSQSFFWPALRLNGGFCAFVMVAVVWLAMIVFHTGNPDAMTRTLPIWLFGGSLAWLIWDVALPRRAGWRHWLPALFTLLTLWFTYRHLPTNCGLPRYAFDAALSKLAPLSKDRLYLSLYPSPEKKDVLGPGSPARATLLRPGSTNLFAGLHFINGYSPIMGAGIGRRWKMATHGEVPPEVTQELLLHKGDTTGELAGIGVDGLIIAKDYPLEVQPPAEEWTAVYTSPDGTVYHRREGPQAPVCFLPTMAGNLPEMSLTVVENSRQQVIVDLPAPPPEIQAVSVKFRRPYFPGYAATLNGVSLPVQSIMDGIAPIVKLPLGGYGRLVLRYRSKAVVLGSYISGATLCVILLLGFRFWRVRHAPQITAG